MPYREIPPRQRKKYAKQLAQKLKVAQAQAEAEAAQQVKKGYSVTFFVQ